MNNLQLSHHQHKPGQKKYPICYLLNNFQSGLNIGSLFRVADAMAVETIYLTGSSPVPPNRKIRKTSRASEQYVSYAHKENPLAQIKQLRSQGYTIVSLELTTNSIDISQWSIAPDCKICLIPGAENFGVPEELLRASDLIVHIPMQGYNSSMNVATACAIATYEITRQLRT